MNRIFTLLAIAVLLFPGCKTQFKNGAFNEMPEPGEPVTPEVLTILLEIKNSEADELPDIAVHKIITSKGYLKASDLKDSHLVENGLIIQCVDTQDNVLKQESLPNPLQKRYETTDEHGQLISHQIQLESDIFSFRIQKNPKIHALKIYINRDQKQVLLTHLEL